MEIHRGWGGGVQYFASKDFSEFPVSGLHQVWHCLWVTSGEAGALDFPSSYHLFATGPEMPHPFSAHPAARKLFQTKTL